MPSSPGMTVFPNSAPDSLTPKYWKSVRGAAQRDELGAGADEVVDGVVGVDDGGCGETVGDDVAVAGKHWE